MRDSRKCRPGRGTAGLYATALLCAFFGTRDASGGEGTAFVSRVASPSRKISVVVSVGEELTYAVHAHERTVITPSPLRIDFVDAPPLGGGLSPLKKVINNVTRTWEPPFGKHAEIRDNYAELRLSLRETAAPGRRLGLVFRVYDDGVAYRYTFPEQGAMDRFRIAGEYSTWTFSDDHAAWIADYDGYRGHQETVYARGRLSDIGTDAWVGMPLLVKVADHLYAAVTEAHLDDWAGMYIRAMEKATVDEKEKKAEKTPIRLVSRLAGEGVPVRAAVPHASPWRVIMIGERPGDLVASDIIENLNPPAAIDPSWIRPGKMAWDHWWSGGVNMDMPTNKQYIDLAARMGWKYQLVDWHWYGKPGESDCTTPVEGMDIPALSRYASSRGVRLWLWLNWKDCERRYREAFGLYEQWGIAGVKIDFMARDDQSMVNWYHMIVKAAAEHHLMVNFHGAYKPTGLRRTYPNLVTREGVLGNEYNKWSAKVTPDHNVTIPFTRMLLGPMDYTPGGFLNCSSDTFATGTPTRVQGTRCHQLAMFVVYDSPVTCVCDHPDHYRGPGVEWLRIVPTVWDDTRVLAGAVGEYIVIARRSGRKWFLGAMTNRKPRKIPVPLGFLEPRKYTATIWKDARDAGKDATRAVVERRDVARTSKLQLKLAPGGGAAACFR